MKAQPLAGIQILEVGAYISAPYAGAILASLGAEVVKLEPPEGEAFRRNDGNRSPYFVQYNTGKKSVAIDLKSEAGKAVFMETPWRGLQAEGKQAEKDKWPFLINNGRANHVWQSAYLDQEEELVTDRFPYPYIEMNPADMSELGISEGDLVEIYNDNGSTQAMAWPTPSARWW